MNQDQNTAPASADYTTLKADAQDFTEATLQQLRTLLEQIRCCSSANVPVLDAACSYSPLPALLPSVDEDPEMLVDLASRLWHVGCDMDLSHCWTARAAFQLGGLHWYAAQDINKNEAILTLLSLVALVVQEGVE